MTDQKTLLVGTVGQGVMRSPDNGENWQRAGLSSGLHSDAIIRALLCDPLQPRRVLAGTDKGICLTEDGGETWSQLDSPMNELIVWNLTVDPTDPQTLFAGTGTPGPCYVFKTTDGGKSWKKLPVEIAKECMNVGVPRTTAITVDPTNHNNVWIGLEVDGVRFSGDGGESWKTVDGPFNNPDVHNIIVTAGPPKTVFVLINNEIYSSTDDGANWTSLNIKQNFPMSYPRGARVHPDDPKTLFLTMGDATPGRTGAIMRSGDTGKTWSSIPLPVESNSAMWVLDIQPDDTDLLLAGSRYGYLYRSNDGGDSWSKLWREFSEISSVVWVPN